MIVSKLRRFIFLKLSYSNKQSDTDYSNMNGCQIITPKQGNFSKSLISNSYIPYTDFLKQFRKESLEASK